MAYVPYEEICWDFTTREVVQFLSGAMLQFLNRVLTTLAKSRLVVECAYWEIRKAIGFDMCFRISD